MQTHYGINAVSKAANNGFIFVQIDYMIIDVSQAGRNGLVFMKPVLLATAIYPSSAVLPKYSSSLPNIPTKFLNYSSNLPKFSSGPT